MLLFPVESIIMTDRSTEFIRKFSLCRFGSFSLYFCQPENRFVSTISIPFLRPGVALTGGPAPNHTIAPFEIFT